MEKYIISEKFTKETISEVRAVKDIMNVQYKEISVRPHEAVALIKEGKKVYQREIENKYGNKFNIFFIRVSFKELVNIAE